MLNVNVQKIAQVRKSLQAQQQFDTAVSAIEVYFNDEQNFLKNELSVSVALTEDNYQKLLPLLKEVGLFIRTAPQKDTYTVFYSETPVVEEAPTNNVTAPNPAPGFSKPNAFTPPVDVFQPSVDPILDQAPVVAEIKDSLQKPTKTSVNSQSPFIMPDDHLAYNHSPF